NSSAAHPPTLSVTPLSINLGTGQSAQSSLQVSADTLTDLGLYILTVNATSGSARQDAIFTVEVVPPDFALLPSAIILSVPQGTTVSTTLTVKALGAFTGTVMLSQLIFPSSLQLALNTTSVAILPAHTVNVQLNSTAASYLASTTYLGTVMADSGSHFHVAYPIMHVAHVSPPRLATASAYPK